MAERVVDILEMVEVQAQHRKLVPAVHVFQACLDMLAQLNAVRQSGQRIVVGEERNLLLRVAFLGHVHVDRNAAAGRERRADHGDDAAVV
jgi:hypothetical protein